MTDFICPWCSNKIDEPTSSAGLATIFCNCFKGAVQINVLCPQKEVTTFKLKLINSDLYCYFVNKPGYPRWSIESSIGNKIDGSNILFLQEGVIGLATAAKMLLRFTNLKVFT
jgi:hypothetical protein